MTASPKPFAALLAPTLFAPAMALALLLAGCGRDAAPAAPAASPYAAVARGRVDVEGGLLHVTAPVEGRVSKLGAQEGQSVRRGDLLLELDSTQARLEVKAAEAAVGEAAAQIRALDTQATAAAARAARLRTAADAGVADGQSADDAQAQARQLAAQKEVAAAGRAAAEARLAAARHAVERHRITAPQDGLVTQRLAQAGGQASPAGGDLFVLLPRAPRIVRAELGDARADAVQPGMTAQVSPEDDPDQVAQAKVLRVSPVSGPPRLEDDPQRRGLEHAVECVLALEGDSTLRVGQRVLVRIGGKAP